MKDNLRAQAIIRSYDASTATGYVDVSGQHLAFPVTSFFSQPPNRAPRSGEQVEVIFRLASDGILAVLSVPK